MPCRLSKRRELVAGLGFHLCDVPRIVRIEGIVPITFRLVTAAPGEVWLDDLQIRLMEDVVKYQQD